MLCVESKLRHVSAGVSSFGVANIVGHPVGKQRKRSFKPQRNCQEKHDANNPVLRLPTMYGAVGWRGWGAAVGVQGGGDVGKGPGVQHWGRR